MKFFSQKKILFAYITAFVLYFLASVYITFPLIFHMGNYTTGYGDELLIAWINNWVIHSFLTNPLFLFQGPMYFPDHNTFAFSESLITTSVIAIPLQLLFHNTPIISVNFTYLSSLNLLGFSVFLLAKYITKNTIASLFSGILVIFSPAVMNNYGTLQNISVEFIPFAVISFLHFMKTGKSRYFIFSLLFFLMQVYNSFMPGFFIVFSLCIIFIYQLFQNKTKTLRLITKKHIGYLVFVVLLVLPVIIPYYQVSQSFSYTRDIRDSIHFSLQPEDLLYSSQYSRLHSFLNTLPINAHSQNNEYQTGYIGGIFLILVLISLIYFITHFKKKDNVINSIVIISIIAILMSLGPVLHLGRHTIHKPFPIILPYTLFYYGFPGFKGFRTPVRFEMLFIITMAVVVAYTLQYLVKNLSISIKILIYVLLFAGILIEFNPPVIYYPIASINNFPRVYQWLANTPKNTVIIEMPIYNWNTFPYANIEQLRDYYSTADFRRTVNGYSGFSPPPWQTLVTNLLTYFPNINTLQTLKNMNITYIIIHTSEYDRMHQDKYKVNKRIIPSGNEVISYLEKDSSVKLVKHFGTDYVFTFKQ